MSKKDDDTQDKPKAIRQLDASAQRIGLTEHEQLMYTVTVEQGTTKKEILDPTFWAHVAAKFKPYTEITVRCDDGTLYAKLLVTQAERTYAKVHVLQWHDLTTRDVAQSQDAPTAEQLEQRYEIKQRGPVLKWCVIDNQANPPVVVREKEESKIAAITWLEGYIKATT